MENTASWDRPFASSLGLGISENPTALQPSLNDCIEVALNHAELLMGNVLKGLETVVLGPRRNAALQTQAIRAAVTRRPALSKRE